MVLNLLTVLIFVVAFFIRLGSATATLGYVLTVVGVIILAIAGNLGGHLAYHFGVGVEESTGRQGVRAP